jgi:hypothetical protein
MTTLNDFLISRNINVTEGNINSNKLQQNEISEILRNNNFKILWK